MLDAPYLQPENGPRTYRYQIVLPDERLALGASPVGTGFPSAVEAATALSRALGPELAKERALNAMLRLHPVEDRSLAEVEAAAEEEGLTLLRDPNSPCGFTGVTRTMPRERAKIGEKKRARGWSARAKPLAQKLYIARVAKRLKDGRKQINLGYYRTAEQAALAYARGVRRIKEEEEAAAAARVAAERAAKRAKREAKRAREADAEVAADSPPQKRPRGRPSKSTPTPKRPVGRPRKDAAGAGAAGSAPPKKPRQPSAKALLKAAAQAAQREEARAKLAEVARTAAALAAGGGGAAEEEREACFCGDGFEGEPGAPGGEGAWGRTPCGHAFHVSCLGKWLRQQDFSSECPVCKRALGSSNARRILCGTCR